MDDDDDFPLADHPGPGGPKAGDREMNRARDLQHLDVTSQRYAKAPLTMGGEPDPEPSPVEQLTPTPSANPVVAAWQAFKTTAGYTGAINSADPGWAMFMAGYAARDSRP
jgi:hypothetical protein